jgi:hypothetical protein
MRADEVQKVATRLTDTELANQAARVSLSAESRGVVFPEGGKMSMISKMPWVRPPSDGVTAVTRTIGTPMAHSVYVLQLAFSRGLGKFDTKGCFFLEGGAKIAHQYGPRSSFLMREFAPPETEVVQRLLVSSSRGET